ncbi:MAG: FecR domain-containing protein [Bacteroidetes bacterium]|nr:FecR domain-containing protein [Bacteroidota bacterium]
MKQNDTYYTDLITRYFSGEAGPDEIRELSAWVQSSVENRRVFEEFRKTWELAVWQPDAESVDIEREWDILSSRMIDNADLPVTQRIRHSRTISFAAGSRWILRIAAVLVLAAVPLFFVYQYIRGGQMEQFVAKESASEILLADGSRITLNKGSVLKYPEEFSRDHRTVILDGEGFFEITRNNEKPFIIEHNNVRVRVLGTSFLINTESAPGSMEVILVNGSVSVYYKKEGVKAGTTLIPGDKAEIALQVNDIRITQNQDPNFISWKTRLFVFQEESLENIIYALNKAYQSQVQLDGPHLSSCRMTASFDRQSLDSILEIIAVTLDLKIETRGDQIILSGKGCQ